MASTQEEQGLLSAFGSMMQDFFTGTVPSFVQGMMGPAPGEVDPGLLQAAEDARNGRLPPVPSPMTTLADPTPPMPSAAMPGLLDTSNVVDNPRVRNLMETPVQEQAMTAETTPKKLVERMAEEWDTTRYGTYVPEGEVDWHALYPNNPHKKAFESQIRKNVPEGRDPEALWKMARRGYLHSKGSYLLSYLDNPNIGTAAVPTYYTFMDGGYSTLPDDVEQLETALTSASKQKHTDMNWKEWKAENRELLSGYEDSVIQNIFYVVKDDEDELALIAALEGINGQGMRGGRALSELYDFKDSVDNEPVTTQSMPTEGYLSKRKAQESAPQPFSPMVYTSGRSRARVGGPGVEATGMGQFPTPQMIGSPGVESPRFTG